MKGHFGQVLKEWEKQKVIDVYRIDVTGSDSRLTKNNNIINQESFDNGITDKFEKFKIKIEEKKGKFHSKPER